MTREELQKSFTKKIIIWGTGEDGHKFYESHKDKISIYAFTTNSILKSDFDRDPPLISPADINYEDSLVVIATTVYCGQIVDQLKVQGRKPFVDFILDREFDGLYDYAFSDAKLLVGIGHCDIYLICQALNRVPELHGKIAVISYDESLISYYRNTYCASYLLQCREALQEAYYVLHGEQISQKRKNVFTDLLGAWKDSRKGEEIIVSLASPFYLFWPQSVGISHYDDKMEWMLFSCHDKFIEKMMRSGQSLCTIYKRIEESQFLDPESILKTRDNSLRLAQYVDRLCNVKIGDYIADNYKEKQLFHNPAHIGKNLLQKYVSRILEYFGLPIENIDFSQIIERTDQYLYNPESDLPIYPQVAEVLGLSFINKDTKYRMEYNHKWFTCDLRQYIEMEYHLYQLQFVREALR